MSEQYERPTLKFVGYVEEAAAIPASETYQIGDYVWARNTPSESATRWLAFIESAHSVRSPEGRRWLVRVRRRQFWSSGAVHMYIDRKLTAEEMIKNRRLGLVPPAGEQPS